MDPAAFLEGHPVALSVYEEVRARLSVLGSFDVHTTKSQIAFRRKRGFAHLWLPGQYLRHPDAEVVLSIALGREVRSGRFKDLKVAWRHARLDQHLDRRPAEHVFGQQVSTSGSKVPSHSSRHFHPDRDEVQPRFGARRRCPLAVRHWQPARVRQQTERRGPGRST